MTVCPKPATGAASALYYVEEETCGITPDNPAWKLWRRTSGNLQLTKDTLSSNELDGNRDRADTRLGQDQTSGDIAVEMSYGSHDDFYAALLGNTWQAGPADITGDTITVNAAAKTFESNNTDYAAAGITPGQLVQFPGLTGDNALPFVVTEVNGTILTAAAAPNDRLTDESAGSDLTFAETVVIGNDCVSFSVLEEYPDLDNGNGGYIITRGVKVVNLSYNMAVNAINTATFQTLGLTQDVNIQLPTGSTFVDPLKTDIYTGVDGSVLEDGEPLSFITSADATTDTEASTQFELGGDSFIEQGRVLSSFDLSAFFVDFSSLEKFKNEESVSINLLMESDDGALMFSYPNSNYTSGAPEVSGPQSITINLSAQANTTPEGSSIVISRIPVTAP